MLWLWTSASKCTSPAYRSQQYDSFEFFPPKYIHRYPHMNPCRKSCLIIHSAICLFVGYSKTFIDLKINKNWETSIQTDFKFSHFTSFKNWRIHLHTAVSFFLTLNTKNISIVHTHLFFSLANWTFSSLPSR